MTTDPSSSVTQARRELGARLRRLRKSAGLTGQAVAEATGQHFTRISRIENGVQPPTALTPGKRIAVVLGEQAALRDDVEGIISGAEFIEMTKGAQLLFI